MTEQEEFVSIVSKDSFKLSVFELSVGSRLHSFRVPFTGQMMSLAQIFFLNYLARKLADTDYQIRSAMYVSQISAILKSLSPAGKKLGPMISISMQGTLFIIPQIILGSHRLSLIFGSALSSLWSFLQPFATLYIYFGHNLLDAFTFYVQKLERKFHIQSEEYVYLLLIPIIIKMITAILVSLYVQSLKSEEAEKIIEKLLGKMNKKKEYKKTKSLWHTLTRPLFLISFVLTISYIYLNRELLAPTIWTYLRPVAIFILIFQINRSSFLKRWTNKNQHIPFFKILKSVNEKIEKNI